MHQFSDSDSDSDKGIRYKTDSTRNKIKNDTDTARSLDQRHSRDRRHERHRRHSKDRYKRQRSRSNSRDNKRDRHKRRSERKSCTRDRSLDLKKDSIRGNLAESDNNSYNKTTGRQRKRSQDRKRAEETCKNTNSDSRRLKDNRDPKSEYEVKESLQKSKLRTTKDSYNKISDVNKDSSIDSRENLFGPSLPPHLQKENSVPACLPKEPTIAETDNVEETERLGKPPIIKPTSSSGPIDNNSIKNEASSPTSDHSTVDIALLQCGNIYGPALPTNLEKEDEVLNLNTEQPKELKEISTEKPDDAVSQMEQPMPSKLIDENSSKSSILKANYCESNASIIGPALPPHLQKKEPVQNIKESVSVIPCTKHDEGISNGLVIGPALPPHLQKTPETKQDDSEVVGPVLPPHLQKEVDEQAKIIGPSLPPHLRQQLQASHGNTQIEEQDQSDEDDTYGPLPPGMSVGRAHVELEERALQLKIDQLGPKEDEEPKREEWMLELPEAKAASFGLGPRQFRARECPDMSDRSSWTTTPKDVGKKLAETKVDLKQESKLRHIKEKDKQQEEIVKTTKRTKKSLMEIHQKKLMKDKKSEEPAERRPFSRDIDLQVRRLDEAQKKAVLKSAHMLDDKFSSGQARYL
ncbi:unnamed protein product [Callosobruchus maculatus]|uniref:DUF3752 domain-containing protein n=1 Tax=Callosobruchus maculatus TaxID=64391 RepID=A0A653BVM7_CALMS|nr:unnamed protein product [Callosobruchus maculatus]